MKKGLFLLLFFSICHNFLGQEALQGEKIRRISFKEEPIPEPTIVKLDENTTSRGTSFRAASAGRSGSISDVMTQGELSVSGTGGASYTLPISVPQGLQGIVPTISINYNSQGGNGMAGYGWNVSGISVISRTGSTMYHDGKISGVDFSENDRFLLDGQRLILKTGQYGKDGATYQTENFSHIKIKSVGVSPYGASYGAKHFEVLYPDGSKAYYGLTDDSHSHTDYAISYWENPQGIRITYHYLKSGNRSFIQKITYGKKGTIGDNEVRFLYKNRTRKEFAYVGGIRFENTLLLDKIQSFSKGQEYRTYTLGYGGKHNSLGYDRLISVQESIGYNYKDPIYFYYSNTQSSVTPKQASYNISSLGNITDYNTKCLSLDLDGDRLSDFVLYPKMGDDAFKKVYLFDDFRKENPNSHNFPFSVNLEKFTQLFSGKILVGQDKNIYIDNDALFSVHQDYNKIKIKSYVRGVVAPLYFQYEKEWNLPVYYERDESWCDKNTNPTPNEPMPLMPRYEGTEKYVPVEIFDGDFNGDGLTDVLAVERNYNIQDCQPNHRDRPPRILDSPHYDSFDDCRCNSYTAGGYSVHWIDLDTRKTSNYSSLVGNLSKRFDSGVLKAIDITGNGKTNLVHITNGEILVYEFNNNNHLELLWRYTHSRIQARMPFIQGDYNGDGKIDFLVPIENNSNRFVMFYNTGKGFEPSENNYPFTFRETFSEKKEKKSGWFLWKEITRYSIYHQYGLLAIDINNDGKTDIIDTYFNRVPDEFPEEKREGFFAIYENEALNFRKTAQQNFPYDDLTPHIITMNSDRRDIYADILSVSRNTIKSFHFNKDSGTEVRLSAVSHRYDIDRSSNNNYGNEGKITYKISYDRLTERFDYYSHDRKPLTIYQKSYEERFPYIDVGNVPSMFVVSKIQREGGRVPEAEQQFRYAGAVSHMSGLGFLGFTSVGRTNWYSKNNEYGEALYTHTIMNPHLKGAVIQDFTTHSINNYGIIPIHNYIQKNEYNYENQTDSHKIFRLKLTQKQSEDKITGVTSLERFSYDDDMNPVRQEITMGTTQKIVETSYVSKSVNPYLVGRVASQKTSSTIDGDTFTTEEQYVYQNNLVTSKKIKGHNTDFKTEKYSYDDVGNIIRKEIIAENGESRREDMQYDVSKRFLVNHIDFEGGTTYKYDDYKGTLQEEINDLGQKTKYEYDVWGRPTRVTDFLGKSVHTYYYSSSSGNSIETTSDDGSYNKESYNALGLLETSVTRNPFDRDVIVKYQYDAQGRVIRQSLPYFDGHSPKWIETSYDRYGRVTQTSHPTGKVTRFTYNGLATTVVDGEKTTTTTKNASGQTIKQEDLGGVITYSYFGNGNLKNANYQGALQQISQDGWGRKTALNDPSAGNYTYQYDVWGRIIQENTPQGSTSYKYDNVTELLQEKHITGNSTDMRTTYAYNFDRLLTRVSLTNADGNNEEYHYQYNPNKQIETLTETKQGGSVTFTKKFFYNEFGDIAEQEYTANAYGKDVFTHIFYDYNYGYLTAIRNKGDVVWELNDVNEYGQPISITKGKTTEKFQYDDSFLTYHSVSTDFGLIEEKSYHFDKAKGLLNHRLYSFNAERENFGYDNLERLVSWTDKGKTQTHIYDERGRITQNSLVGQYTYENHKYQQKALKTNELGNAYYDQHAVPDVLYNAFKSPIEIKVDSPKQKEVISYQYDAFGGRSASYYGGLEPDKTSRRFEKHYNHDGSFEVKKDKHTGKITFLVYLDGDAYSAHSVYRAEDDNKDYLYLHRDYLGSITSITDSEGKTLEKRHFNAWGEITQYWNAQGQTTIPAEGILLDRGYTGHEHLLGVGLIHMNGRLYDPVLHRFLQPDNYIQDPFNTQNFNRYGYVLNNPLLYTDPSGEEFVVTFTAGVLIGGVLASIGGMSAENWRDIKNWVGNVGKSIGNWFERQFNSVSSWFKVDSSPQVIGQYPIQRSQYNYPIVPYRNDISQIQLPTQHHFLGINMTALSQGNMLQQMAYHTINDLYTIPQMLMLRRVGDSSNPMINLNGTSKTTEQGVQGLVNSAMWGYSHLFRGVNVAKAGIKLSETKLLNKYNSVESLIEGAGKLTRVKGATQGFVQGDGVAIFKALTQNAKLQSNGQYLLKNGYQIGYHYSKTTGIYTIHITPTTGKMIKIRVKK